MEGEAERVAQDEQAALVSVRLSDIELPFSLAERDSRLQSIDSLLEEYVLHSRMILERWGFSEALILGIGTLALILGAWDLGIGELASGGDYNRNWFEGFLHVSDFSLMLSLLSLIGWIGLLASLWARFPLMRENLIWMTLATLAIQFGYLLSHSTATNFPFDAGVSD